MKYTKYFSHHVEYNGIPHFSILQFQRMMNIVFMEGSINSLPQLNGQGYSYTLESFKKQRVLTELTGNLTPENLYIEMIRLSY